MNDSSVKNKKPFNKFQLEKKKTHTNLQKRQSEDELRRRYAFIPDSQRIMGTEVSERLPPRDGRASGLMENYISRPSQ